MDEGRPSLHRARRARAKKISPVQRDYRPWREGEGATARRPASASVPQWRGWNPDAVKQLNLVAIQRYIQVQIRRELNRPFGRAIPS
jgi:hypothetical protein